MTWKTTCPLMSSTVTHTTASSATNSASVRKNGPTASSYLCIQRTFRAHSGNIQSTFGEHSVWVEWTPVCLHPNCQKHFKKGNIQGTFSKHLGRVERTPVCLHPNCQKHFKKVPRLTQNTTCKHEYLRRGFTRPNDVSQE